eukprot:CAMPEP_0201636754 /NCGR_PEP_ID=MMETSP0493-20130528/9564_1 /ASSEMBLY_ACC=CAM_ASM_000838 /TAXON_ID=420259 /ORGANISM="Thalassiosira gravida, Strain GMp14c1" /LENGTH=59 /DNA_ID=CAMNT_0048108961 /DNA_START=579 /DNA_END=754 /DNA_ORIENTATION=-
MLLFTDSDNNKVTNPNLLNMGMGKGLVSNNRYALAFDARASLERLRWSGTRIHDAAVGG